MSETLPLDLPPGPSAVKVVEDGPYRYFLSRTWAPGAMHATWVMHHPSTDAEFRDSATIKRCMAYSQALGCTGMIVVNLYAYKSEDLTQVPSQDAVGPENDTWLKREFVIARAIMGPLIAAWGTASPNRVEQVMRIPGAERMSALGVSRGGHPLLPRSAPDHTVTLTPWPVPDDV